MATTPTSKPWTRVLRVQGLCACPVRSYARLLGSELELSEFVLTALVSSWSRLLGLVAAHCASKEAVEEK